MRPRVVRVALLALVLFGTSFGCRRSYIGNAGSTESPQQGAQPAASYPQPAAAELAPPPQTAAAIVRPGPPGAADVLFEIRANEERKPISPYVYGMNGGVVSHLHSGVIRSGGNRLTAYNWENNASNAGSDYLFQNDSLIDTSDAPARPLLQGIDAAIGVGAATIITLSNVDYVAADKNGGGDVRSSGPNYLAKRFKRNFAKKPTPFSALPDTNDNAVYQDELVFFLKTQRPHARVLFSMDNEPELWSHTHAEVHPKPVTYAELWKRNHDFAKAAKDVWPSAEVLGFVSYGYMGFVSLQNAADANGRNFIEWYLDQAKAAEKTEGKRLIDYLDLHWYPEAQAGGKRIVGGESDPDVVAAREQAPRSLWDRSYQETSWIRDMVGGPLDLLHWVQAKIDAHYPGTKLAFTEWNYGGGNQISGSIAAADVLGLFGRHGVGLATYWRMIPDESFAFAAFHAYLDYDGNGSAFGDTSISASTNDAVATSVYASIDSNDPKRTVIIAINKAATSKKAGITISHSAAYGSANVFLLTGAKASVAAAAPIKAVALNAFNYEMPAQSVSVIVPQL